MTLSTHAKLGLLVLLLMVVACASANEAEPVKLANPASEYCISIGGTLKIETKSDGQVGYCHLPSGKVVEEWTLFRSKGKKQSE